MPKQWTTHQQEEAALALCIAINANVIIWGAPGAGKTSVMNAISAANNLHLETILASTKEPQDFAGFPFISDGAMQLAPPLWAKNVVQQFNEHKRTSMVLFDEINTAAPASQAALLTTMLDRKAGETQMPKRTRMVAAANPPKVAANGWNLTAPMANRFTHLDWNLDADTIVRGFQLGWEAPLIPQLPSDMKLRFQNAEILVGGFIKRFPQYVVFDFTHFSGNVSKADFKASNNAWPSARSWTMAARLFAAGTAATVDGEPISQEVTRILLEGTVGVQATTEFLAHIRSFDIPNPADLLNSPSSFEIPPRADQIFVVLSAVHHEAIRYASTPQYAAIWNSWGDIIAKVATAGKADVCFEFAKVWLKERPEGSMMSQSQAQAFEPLKQHLGKLYE